ncbi:MAG: hypothetical protein RL748_3132 [Pseudomonadota bacterium]|jgi:hypothetical protein
MKLDWLRCSVPGKLLPGTCAPHIYGEDICRAIAYANTLGSSRTKIRERLNTLLRISEAFDSESPLKRFLEECLCISHWVKFLRVYLPWQLKKYNIDLLGFAATLKEFALPIFHGGIMFTFPKPVFQHSESDKFGYTRYKDWLVIIFFFKNTASQLVFINQHTTISYPLELLDGKLRIKGID